MLWRFKTYLRKTVGKHKLTGLTLIHERYETEIYLYDVIDIILFARKHSCCMLVKDIFALCVFLLVYTIPSKTKNAPESICWC